MVVYRLVVFMLLIFFVGLLMLLLLLLAVYCGLRLMVPLSIPIYILPMIIPYQSAAERRDHILILHSYMFILYSYYYYPILLLSLLPLLLIFYQCHAVYF